MPTAPVFCTRARTSRTHAPILAGRGRGSTVCMLMVPCGSAVRMLAMTWRTRWWPMLMFSLVVRRHARVPPSGRRRCCGLCHGWSSVEQWCGRDATGRVRCGSSGRPVACCLQLRCVWAGSVFCLAGTHSPSNKDTEQCIVPTTQYPPPSNVTHQNLRRLSLLNTS